MKPAALAFSGQIGSGKTTLAITISNTLGWKYASFGNYVRKIALEREILDPSREVLQRIGDELISNQGWSKFCLNTLNEANWNKGEGIVIDGIRHVAALTTLREILHPMNVFALYISLTQEIRATRLVSRKTSIEGLKPVEQHSTEVQVQDILKTYADLIIDGSESINIIDKQIFTWLSKNS